MNATGNPWAMVAPQAIGSSPFPTSSVLNLSSIIQVGVTGTSQVLNNGSLGFNQRYSTWTGILSRHNPTALYIDRTVTPIWYLVGLVGNIISALVWSERRTRRVNSSAIYLTSLAITDLLVLVLHCVVELEFAWGIMILGRSGVCQLYFVFCLCFQYCSPLLVLVFTVERWIAVCWPFKKEKYCSEKRAKRVVFVCILSMLIICLPQAYYWVPVEGLCLQRTGTADSYTVWTWGTELLIFLCMPCVNLAFNVLVIRETCRVSKRAQYRTSHKQPDIIESSGALATSGRRSLSHRAEAHARVVTTMTLLCVSFYVVVSTLPATLVYLIRSKQGEQHMTDEEIDVDPTWILYFRSLTIRKVIEELCMSHYACNFFLYALTGEHFRKRAWQVLVGKRNDRDAERRLSMAYLRSGRKSTARSKASNGARNNDGAALQGNEMPPLIDREEGVV